MMSSASSHVLARLDIAELVLAHVSRNPARPALEEAQQRLAGADILARRQPQVGDVPSAGATTSVLRRSRRA